MSKKFDIISIILIVMLVIILFMVVFNYFKGSSERVNTNLNSPINISGTSGLISGSGDTLIITNNIINDENNSGENISGEEQYIISSGDNRNEESNSFISSQSQNDGNIYEPNSTSLIVSSNDEISSKEKKEVLKELDQTLMDLLEVVDSVKTVDETRLITDENGGGE